MSKASPFFANFIESQVEELTSEEMAQTSGGSLQDLIDKLPKDFKPPFEYVTMKAPSDDDEGVKDIELFNGPFPGEG